MLESFKLVKEFRKISPFSFTFKPDFNVIVGENGSGKSSFLHLITNLEENKDICDAKYKPSDFIFFDTEKQNPRVILVQVMVLLFIADLFRMVKRCFQSYNTLKT